MTQTPHDKGDRKVDESAKSWARHKIETDFAANGRSVHAFLFQKDEEVTIPDHNKNDYFLQVWAFIPGRDKAIQSDNITEEISTLLGWTIRSFRSGSHCTDGLLVGGYSKESMQAMGYETAYSAARDDAVRLLNGYLSALLFKEYGAIDFVILT